MLCRSLKTKRRGAAIVYAAITITLLVSLAALAFDVGYKHDRLRHVQASADASALSGAADMFKHWLTNRGTDPSYSGKQAALDIASANKYPNLVNGSNVEVYIPPQSGPNVGKAGYIEVIVTKNDTRFFSKMLDSNPMTTRARAVARSSFDEIGEGVIVLDRYVKGALNAHGGGIMTLKGSSFIVNSNHTEAAITNGSEGSQLRADGFRITGNYTETGSSTFAQPNGSTPANILTGTPPIPDPLAYLPTPDKTTMPGGTSKIEMIDGVKTTVLTPGVYNRGLSFSGKENVLMKPGIYYMDNGGFNFGGQGNLTAQGVMIYNDTSETSNSMQVSITGQGIVNMTPPTSGIYKGILIFQERTSTTEINIVGNGNFHITGTFYAANANVKISGNGDSSIGSQFISRTLDIGGNGALTIDYPAAPHPARRILQLVE